MAEACDTGPEPYIRNKNEAGVNVTEPHSYVVPGKSAQKQNIHRSRFFQQPARLVANYL